MKKPYDVPHAPSFTASYTILVITSGWSAKGEACFAESAEGTAAAGGMPKAKRFIVSNVMPVSSNYGRSDLCDSWFADGPVSRPQRSVPTRSRDSAATMEDTHERPIRDL